ncbi:hypothetical protein HY988_07175 [Candidatus Micrarchaeota archaeon]|nr:hypothetical protein [Candidatus Micrarchaeota archaeon]
MIFSTVKRLAGDILNVGRNKIWVDPQSVNEIRGAQTRADIKQFIEKGMIKKINAPGRASAPKKERRGEGHRRGTTIPQKDSWMQKVRAQRKLLQMLLSSGALKKDQKWALYRKIKSGLFRNKRAIVAYLQDAGLLGKDFVMPKAEFKKISKPKPAPKKAQDKSANKQSKSEKPKTEKPKSQDKGAQPESKIEQPKRNPEQTKHSAEAPKNQAPHHNPQEGRHSEKAGEM